MFSWKWNNVKQCTQLTDRQTQWPLFWVSGGRESTMSVSGWAHAGERWETISVSAWRKKRRGNQQQSCVLCCTGILSQMRTKLRDRAVWQARGGCYSQASMSSNDSKTLYLKVWSCRHMRQILFWSLVVLLTSPRFLRDCVGDSATAEQSTQEMSYEHPEVTGIWWEGEPVQRLLCVWRFLHILWELFLESMGAFSWEVFVTNH